MAGALRWDLDTLIVDREPSPTQGVPVLTIDGRWKYLHDQFAARADEEERMGGSHRLCAYGDYTPPARAYGNWAIGHSPSEYFSERFRNYATEAGSLLDCPH